MPLFCRLVHSQDNGQWMPLSSILLMTFMDEAKGQKIQVQFGGVRVLSLLFVDVMILLASVSWTLQLLLDWLTAKCEAVRMAMVLVEWGGMPSPSEILPQVEEYLFSGFGSPVSLCSYLWS